MKSYRQRKARRPRKSGRPRSHEPWRRYWKKVGGMGSVLHFINCVRACIDLDPIPNTHSQSARGRVEA